MIVPHVQCESERKFDTHNLKDEDTGARAGTGGVHNLDKGVGDMCHDTIAPLSTHYPMSAPGGGIRDQRVDNSEAALSCSHLATLSQSTHDHYRRWPASSASDSLRGPQTQTVSRQM